MSKVQATTTICESVIAPAMGIQSFVTQEQENSEKFFSHTSNSAERHWKPPALHSVHCIANKGGEVLVGMNGKKLQLSSNPLDAVASGHVWFSSTVAAANLHRLRRVMPDVALGLSLLVLRAMKNGEWELVSSQGYGVSCFNEDMEIE